MPNGIHDDGDIIRAVGMVALHFADLEQMVDGLLEDLGSLIEVPRRIMSTFSFRAKLEYLEENFLPLYDVYPESGFNAEEHLGAERIIADCRWCACERNNILHSPILHDLRRDEIIQMSRQRGLVSVDSAHIYSVAERVWATGGQVHHVRFGIERLKEAAETRRRAPPTD